MKRKYQIFISSPFTDLEEHRRALIFKTLKMDHIPAGMEFFHPGEPRNIEVIKQEIESSDIFVILVGARLGSVIVGEDLLTYTMKEYNLAMSCKLPIIPLILNDEEYKRERDNITSDRQNEREQQRQLDDFRSKVQFRADGEKRIAGFFSYSRIDELCDKFGDAVHKEAERLGEKGTGGWVKGELYDDLNARIAFGTAVSNPFFKRYAQRLSTFESLAQRTLVEATAKEAIAEYFWGQYMSRLNKKKVSHIYFESGSSIAYVSKGFIDYVIAHTWFDTHKLNTRLKLRTNNLFTYMDFLLVYPPWTPKDIQLMPQGYISNEYGATYGALNSASEEPSPSKPMPDYKIPADAAHEVKKMAQTMALSFTREAGIVLMTSSGIDIDPDSPFPGPHVGSYYNMLVKRCLLSLPCPKVLFLDEIKWGYKFRLGSCHPVCDNGAIWNKYKKNSALAIALAARDKDSLEKLCQSLTENGFSHLEIGAAEPGTDGPIPIIAANDLFAQQFE